MGNLLLRVRAVAVLLFSWTGCGPISCEHEPERGVVTIEPAVERSWPRALAPDLAPATPATEVTVHPDRIEVNNEALVATWPPDALSRAQRASEGPGWPRIAERIALTEPTRGLDEPALQAALVRARRAERSATGEGTGAGAFNLRVASDVPFAAVERVLYAAARAGYGAPWIVLEADDVERVLRWPSARPGAAPTREEIEAAMRGDVPALAPQPPRARVVLTNDRVTATQIDDRLCTIEGPLEHRAIDACARELRGAEEPITLEVAPDARFDRVASMVQVFAAAFEEVRVVRGPAR